MAGSEMESPKSSRVMARGPLKRLGSPSAPKRSSADSAAKVKRKARSRPPSPPPNSRVEIGAMRRSTSSVDMWGREGVRRTLSDDMDSPSKKKSGSFISRLFKAKETSPNHPLKETALQLIEERQAQHVAKMHFARAATVLHPIPFSARTATIDFNSASTGTFLEQCRAKSAASQGMGVTPAIVNEVLALARQFPDFPPKLLPTLITRMDGNLNEVQLALVELGWGGSSVSGSSATKGRPRLEEFTDEPDAHFSTSYYLGLVSDFAVPLKLIAAAPVGSYCTFLTREGRAYQYHALYQLPTDVLVKFLGSTAVRCADSTEGGAIVHENIVAPRVYASWRASRRLAYPVVNRQVVSACVDVPLLADRLNSMGLRQSI